jgi:large subunit ribosomal protein L22
MVKAELNNYRQSPRKVRLIVDAIRGKNVNDAITTLTFMVKRGALPVQKLLESAMANATHNFNLKTDNLFIKEITVDQGPILKRWRARARGRASSIHKHTSHIKLVLAEKDVEKTVKSVKTEKTAKKEVTKDNK